jgi:hypothetical protein
MEGSRVELIVGYIEESYVVLYGHNHVHVVVRQRLKPIIPTMSNPIISYGFAVAVIKFFMLK